MFTMTGSTQYKEAKKLEEPVFIGQRDYRLQLVFCFITHNHKENI